MASFPLSLRLVAMPFWWLASGRLWLYERGGAVLRVRVDERTPLPSVESLLAVLAAADVHGLWVTVEAASGGWATLAAVRESLLALRKGGKRVIVEMERAGNAEMFLASAADRAFIRPTAQVWLVGIGAVMRFGGEALARFGLAFDVEAAGAYKSFGEMFSRAWASPENREATAALVSDLQTELESSISSGRGMTIEAVRAAMAGAPLSAEESVASGLLDGAKYPDEVEKIVEELFGEETRVVEFAAWWKAANRRRRFERFIAGGPRIVVVHLAGAVVDGHGNPGADQIAAAPVCEVLAELAENERVRGVVLHIHSPGGSATASDLIWRAVRKLGEEKPVVAVFGDVSASGGYYIGVAASEIVANAATLTGSIGVVGGKVVARPALAALGVHTEVILGAPQADFFSDAAFNPEQRSRFRAGLERAYREFVERVAAGRKQPYDTVEPHARGRVWTGRRALELGLIDGLGGIEEGISRAARLASVTDPRRVDLYLVRRGARLRRLLRSLVTAAVPEVRHLKIPETVAVMLANPGAALALWWGELEIK